MQLTILTPIYDDWVSFSDLLADIHAVMGGSAWRYDVVVVDDASPVSQPPSSIGALPRPANCRDITVLRLCKNLGHQRAIAVGLVHIHSRDVGADSGVAVVAVMDGDGEDDPRDLPRLLEACSHAAFSRIVFARRTRRSESLRFRLGYEAYCLLHRVAVGYIPRVGNFSVVPGKLLQALVVDPNLWNHFAAAIFASRLPRESVPTPRARRYAGQSKLNFVGLIIHGFSALACYSEIIGVRAVVAAVFLCLINSCVAVAAIGLHLLTSMPVPGWAGTGIAAGLIVSLQLLAVAVVFSLLTLSGRHDASFLPLRDAPVHILEQRSFDPP